MVGETVGSGGDSVTGKQPPWLNRAVGPPHLQLLARMLDISRFLKWNHISCISLKSSDIKCSQWMQTSSKYQANPKNYMGALNPSIVTCATSEINVLISCLSHSTGHLLKWPDTLPVDACWFAKDILSINHPRSGVLEVSEIPVQWAEFSRAAWGGPWRRSSAIRSRGGVFGLQKRPRPSPRRHWCWAEPSG